MNRKIILSFFLTIILLCSFAVSGMAANEKAASAVPNVKISSDTEVEVGFDVDVTITSSVPGFLRLELRDAMGSPVLVLFDNSEIHSKDNDLTLSIRNDQNQPLPAGDYVFAAVVTSQFGVASKEVTAKIRLTPSLNVALDGNGFPITNTQNSAMSYLGTGTGTTTAPVTATYGSTTTYGNTTTYGGTSAYAGTNTAGTSAYSGTAGTQAAAQVPTTPLYDAFGNLITPAGTVQSSQTAQTAGMNYAAPAVQTEVVNYVRSTGLPLGAEGYEIGLGVNDTYPQTDPGFWGLSSTSTDEEIWAAIIRPMTVLNLDEQEVSSIYNTTADGRRKIATITGASQGINVLEYHTDGWALVEAYDNETGAFVRGYLRSNKLKTVEPNTVYGFVIDKASQTLSVFMNGKRIGSCLVCTGKPTVEALSRETTAGEFICVTRNGTVSYLSSGYSKYTIRFNNNQRLQEIPSTKKGGSDFSILQPLLGTKATRGNVAIPHIASTDGGINAEWIWNITDANRKVKVLILDDKPRNMIPVGK